MVSATRLIPIGKTKHRRIHAGTDDFEQTDDHAATYTDLIQLEKFDLSVPCYELLLKPAMTSTASNCRIKFDDSELPDPSNFELPPPEDPEDNPPAPY